MPGFTDDQIAALSAPLAREHVKTREQAHRQVSYIEGWHAIAEANRIFGFDGWDRTTKIHCVSEKPSKIGERQADGWRVAYTGKVRVKVRAGDTVIVRDGSGYGSGIDVDLGSAHESAAKECETDCLKRALMTFGYPFGLALYDKAQSHVERPPKPPQKAAEPPRWPRTPNGGPPSMPPVESPQGSVEHQLTMGQVRDRILERLKSTRTLEDVRALLKMSDQSMKTFQERHQPVWVMLNDAFNKREQDILRELEP